MVFPQQEGFFSAICLKKRHPWLFPQVAPPAMMRHVAHHRMTAGKLKRLDFLS
jgi:hypothetical protein